MIYLMIVDVLGASKNVLHMLLKKIKIIIILLGKRGILLCLPDYNPNY